MTVYGEQLLIDFAKKHAAARKPIARFLALAKAAEWTHAEDMKQTFPSVDYASETKTAIFDLGGNKYRILARMNFEELALRILEVLTHEKYDRKRLYMPTAYQELLIETEPEVIETREQYDAIYARFGVLFDKGRRGRTPEEEKLYRLLGLLVQDYDRRHALPKIDDTPAERLQYVLEVSQRTQADLIPVFGQKSHVSEALKGRRPISAEQARMLGKMFHLEPGYFI